MVQHRDTNWNIVVEKGWWGVAHSFNCSPRLCRVCVLLTHLFLFCSCVYDHCPVQDVYLSVCLSVTRRCSVETAQHIISSNFFLYRVATPVLQSNAMALLRRGYPNGGIERKGCEKIAISTNIWLYLRNGIRCGTDSFNRRPTQRCHFEWSWMT